MPFRLCHVLVEPRLNLPPSFMALDIRIDWTHVFPWADIEIYADLVNALNLQPQEGWLYNFDFPQREPLLGLPLIPSVGFNAVF